MTFEMALDWDKIFGISQPVLETVIRGSCMYVAAFALLRIFRRQAGAMGAADLLVLLFIADAAQNGMAGEYHSVTDGIILVGTIMIWEYTFDWLSFRSKTAAKLLEASPLLLVKNGRIKNQNLASELMTMDDLISQLRKKGVDDLKLVRLCYLEGDGHISVITDDGTDDSIQSEDDSRH